MKIQQTQMKIEHDQGISILGDSDKIVLEPYRDLPVFIGNDKDKNPCLCIYDAINENKFELVSHEDLCKAEFTLVNNVLNIIVDGKHLFYGKIYITPRSINDIIDVSTNN